MRWRSAVAGVLLAAVLLVSWAAISFGDIEPRAFRAGFYFTRDPAFRGSEACRREGVEDGIRVIVYLGDRSCVRFKPARTYSGLYVNAFEGQQFIVNGRSRNDVARDRSNVWFSTDEQTAHNEATRCPRRHVCQIVFEGREAVDMNRPVLEGYGHMGVSAGVVLADRILSTVDLGTI